MFNLSKATPQGIQCLQQLGASFKVQMVLDAGLDI